MRSKLSFLALATAALWLAVGCDCSSPTGTPCDSDDDCPMGQRCSDGMCRDRPDVDGGPGEPDASSLCPDERPRCGAVCCGDGEVCDMGVCALDCGERPICDGACCESGQECLDGACVIECEDEANRCGEAGELCCDASQACLSDACVDLGEPCERTEDCEVEEICLPSLERCVPRDSVEVCEFRPPVGEFSPVTACQWRPPPGSSSAWDDVVMTPAVMNLTDDDGDGATDTNDIPDIVFIAFDRQTDGCCTSRGRLVIASGACNPDGTMDTHAILESPFVDNSSGVALGNLHPDSRADARSPEIVATFRNGGTIAWTRVNPDGSLWTELWRNEALPTVDHMRSGGAPSIADLNGDGQPEVIVGNVVLDGLTGEKVWDGFETVGAGAGVGNNAFLGPTSTVADIDLDGTMEVIAGNTVYDGPSGAEEWTFEYTTSNSPCGGSVPCDGFNAIGDFDDDPEAEVVIVRLGEVFVLQHDGSLLHRVPIPLDDTMPYAGDGPCDRGNESGPPTVADFDGDGRPEIGTASADFYVVVDFDCTGDPLPSECRAENVLWAVPNQDCSSRATGSSVFDFEGDGAAEVVYADETQFRIFDGRTGAILYEDTSHSSNTRMEMPIVVDVDNDGKSEVVIPEPNTDRGSLGGIEIWEDADNNWVRTRRVWNQHTYHVTNIGEDGQVPRTEEPNWRNGRLNNFRQNVQPGGLFDAPDLVLARIELDECTPSPPTLDVAVTVENRGALGVPPGISVVARATLPDGSVVDLGVQTTTTTLLPGGSETLIFTWMPSGGFGVDELTVEAIVDDDGTGEGDYNECVEDNNALTSETLMTCSFG
ncbi:MAG TPA: VCBS repeat-containing protein [Sandaracinaceae bacterium LLY-WYZ-13_1]|nr:VCBS repeat-containing protein [Sandaracinaceae bacterium LLY-WYZ-13_1]